MIVRWMGLFERMGQNISHSLNWEWENHSTERAAEWLCGRKQHGGRKYLSNCFRSQVGLMFRQSDVTKRWKGDVWSERTKSGKLIKTRRPEQASSLHWEVWIRGLPMGVVMRNNAGGPPSRWVKDQVISWARTHNLPIYYLTRKGALVEYKDEYY